MSKLGDPVRLKKDLRRAEKRLAQLNRSVLDNAALKAAEDLCDKARGDLVAYNQTLWSRRDFAKVTCSFWG
jgi:hypothetical protein